MFSTMFLIPPVASAILLIIVWSADKLRRPGVAACCVLVAVLAQWLAPTYSGLWLTALLVNVGLAIYLAIRVKLSW